MQQPVSVEKLVADIRAAMIKPRIAEIWQYASGAWSHDPAALQHLAAECQARDAFLTNQGGLPLGAPPAPSQQLPPPPPPGPPQPQRPGASTMPVGPQPPGWMANASAIGIGTRNALGLGGVPAADVLRVALVDVAVAAWDCGLDLSDLAELKDVSAATPEKLWEIAAQMLDRIRNHVATQRQLPRR